MRPSTARHDRISTRNRLSWRRTASAVLGLALSATLVGMAPASAAPNQASAPAPAARPDGAPAHPLAASTNGSQRHRSGEPVPPQVADLAFLRGDYRCVSTTAGEEEPAFEVGVRMTTKPILGGHQYEMTLVQDEIEGVLSKITGKWVFGWNPVDSQFYSFYYDDHDSIGHTTSAGWIGGRLTFEGWYDLYGGTVTTRDSYEIVNSRRFIDRTSFLDDNGQWIPLSVIDCRK